MKLHTHLSDAHYYTERCKTILKLRSYGKTISEVADKVNMSSRRVESLIFEMRRMNKCENEVQLVAMALRTGIID